jgi:hypothetical protein
VRCSVAQLDEPSREPDLGSDGEYGTRVRPRLEGIDETVDDANERGRIALPEGQRRGQSQSRATRVKGGILPNGDKDGEERLERMWEGRHESPCGELLSFRVRQTVSFWAIWRVGTSNTYPLYG